MGGHENSGEEVADYGAVLAVAGVYGQGGRGRGWGMGLVCLVVGF